MWIIIFFLGFLPTAQSNEIIEFNKELSESDYLKLHRNQKFLAAIKKYQYIDLEILNQGEDSKELYFAIKDNKSRDYWGQLTYKTHLSLGLNTLSINTNRNVGERGSSKYQRLINKNKIKEIFIVFNPEKRSTKESLKLTKIRFYNLPQPKISKGISYFLFGDYSELDYPFASKITDKTRYSKKQAGFETIKLWRKRDAQIAPLAWSKSLSVKKATFSMNLAKGEYNIELVWDELGYWEAPFWSIRKWMYQGGPLLVETRTDWSAFLKDLFRFQHLSIQKPFDSLRQEIFKPVKRSINHPGGKLSFTFSGDASGVSLNSLLIYPKDKSKQADEFNSKLIGLYEHEFDAKYRLIKTNKKEVTQKVTLSDFENQKNYYDCVPRVSKKYVLLQGENVKIRLCFHGLKGQKISFSFKDKNKARFYRIVPYLGAFDLNHESYGLRPHHLEPFNGKSYKPRNNFEVIEVELNPKKDKKLSLQISYQKGKERFDLKLITFKKKSDLAPIKVGFFGPTPMPFTYFEGRGKNQWIRDLHKNTLNKLRQEDIGFITDSYKMSLEYNKLRNKFQLLTDSSFTQNKKKKYVYFYQAKDLKSLIAGHPRNSAQKEKDYDINLKQEFSRLQKSSMSPKFVYLYSDEATGYRDAVKKDIRRFHKIKKRIPSLSLGGFGNLYDEKKGKELYKLWDVGFYTDLPNQSYVKKLSKWHKNWGVYNLCAEPNAPMKLCYGIILYKLHHAGVKTILEWHLNSAQNYPYFDLDGREADIAMLVTNEVGELKETYRYRELQNGLRIYNKLLALDKYLAGRKAPGLSETKARDWLDSVKKIPTFPVKKLIKSYQGQDLSNFYLKLDQYCEKFLR